MKWFKIISSPTCRYVTRDIITRKLSLRYAWSISIKILITIYECFLILIFSYFWFHFSSFFSNEVSKVPVFQTLSRYYLCIKLNIIELFLKCDIPAILPCTCLALAYRPCLGVGLQKPLLSLVTKYFYLFFSFAGAPTSKWHPRR